MTMNELPQLVRMHKAIGHPVRLRLLAMLRGGPLCVCQMTVIVQLASSTVSEHLAELRNAGIVTERKEGRWVAYRLAENPVARKVLAASSRELERDPDAQADAIVLRELRRVSLEELCGADLDLRKLDRPRLAAAVVKARKIRPRA